MKTKKLIYCLLMCLSGLAAACSSDVVREKELLSVSIEPLRRITERLAGDRFDVYTLTPSGSGPETYQPTPEQMERLRKSSAYIRVGTLGFEKTQLRKMTESIPHLHIVSASQGIKYLPDGDGSAADNGGDPHTWTSPRNIKVMATNICDALCDLDSLYRPQYISRLYALYNRVDSVDIALRELLSDVKSRTFLIYHPSLSYFSSDYGLEQLCVECEGKEPSAERMACLIEECRRKNVKVVFVQQEYSGRCARRIAEEIGAEVVDINPLGYDWTAEILNIARALSR